MNFGFKNTGGGGGFVNTTTSYTNYSALLSAGVSANTLNYVINSQGTKWLPFSLGGTYYPNGWYYFDGVSYTFQETPFNASQPTVDAGTNNDQFVTPLTLTNATQVKTGDLALPVIAVGGISTLTNVDNLNFPQFVNLLLYPELFPTLTNPSSTFALTQSGLHEIAEVIATLNFASAFNRGSISPAYGTSGFRSGLPNTYKYTGTGLSNEASTSLTNNKTVSSYTVLNGSQSWTAIVAYDGGEQPLSSKGNALDPPNNVPFPAGDTSTKTVVITGVYPFYGTTVDLINPIKQSLALMTSAYVEFSNTFGNIIVAEDGVNKQKVEFPTTWSPITGIQFFNTNNSTWEFIGGSKAASLATFTVSSVTNVIQGNTINYNRYTHNGATIGARGLRFYTT